MIFVNFNGEQNIIDLVCLIVKQNLEKTFFNNSYSFCSRPKRFHGTNEYFISHESFHSVKCELL